MQACKVTDSVCDKRTFIIYVCFSLVTRCICKQDKDTIPTGPAAKPPVRKDGNDLKLPISTGLPSDDSIRQPLLPKRLAEGNPTIPTPETPAVAREWDIMKSIVYGGLIESITSLSVVSSAAGAGSSTCCVACSHSSNARKGLRENYQAVEKVHPVYIQLNEVKVQ